MKIETLEQAFIHELSDVYSAEKQLTKALPRLSKAATNEQLSQGFQDHLAETEGQIERIDQIVEMLGIKLNRIKCKAMEGLIEEGAEKSSIMKLQPMVRLSNLPRNLVMTKRLNCCKKRLMKKKRLMRNSTWLPSKKSTMKPCKWLPNLCNSRKPEIYLRLFYG